MCIVFLILLNCPSVSSCSSPSLPKTAILNSALGKLQISMSSGLVTGRLLRSLGDVMLSWFFMFLAILSCSQKWLAAVTSTSLYSLLWERNTFHFRKVGILRLSQNVCGYTRSMLLFPLVQNSELVYLTPLDSTLPPGWVLTGHLLFVFPKVALKLKSSVSFWPTDVDWLSVRPHYPSGRAHSCCPCQDCTLGASHRVWVYGGKVCAEHCGVPMSHLGASVDEVSWVSHRWACWCRK